MRRRSLALTGALALLGSAALSAPALAAGQAAPGPHAYAAGLLDGLGGASAGGLLGGLLGADDTQPLQDLLAALQGGQAPTTQLLDPLQRLLGELAGTAGLPAGTEDLIAQLQALLASGAPGEPLPANALMPVATLLRDLAASDGVPAETSSLLTQLADVLDGDGAVPGLPVDALSLPPSLIAQLDDLLRQLEGGSEPTGTLLAPVGALLDQAARADGLPPELSKLMSRMGDTLANTGGALDPLLASQLSLALRTIASTPGLSPSTRTTIERISTLIGSQSPSGGAGTARAGARAGTKRDRAVIKRVRVNRARTRIGVRVACPHSAPATCATLVRASLAGRRAAVGKRVRIAPGAAKLVRLRMIRSARASSVAHGGRPRVRVTTSFGRQRFAVAKTVRLPASRH